MMEPLNAAVVNLPPKGKARPRIVRRGRKTRAFMPQDYMDWKEEFGKQWTGSIETIDEIMHVDTKFYTKTGNSRSDMDNAHAAVLDALQDAEIIANDRLVKSGSYSLHKGDSDYIEVTISRVTS